MKSANAQCLLVPCDSKRTRFITLQNAYHGETVGAMSVSDIGLYRQPYEAMLFDVFTLDVIPYVSDVNGRRNTKFI
jgi:adenosylmethionine---8-amino-7-oxononanoate aminotransferase